MSRSPSKKPGYWPNTARLTDFLFKGVFHKIFCVPPRGFIVFPLIFLSRILVGLVFIIGLVLLWHFGVRAKEVELVKKRIDCDVCYVRKACLVSLFDQIFMTDYH